MTVPYNREQSDKALTALISRLRSFNATASQSFVDGSPDLIREAKNQLGKAQEALSYKSTEVPGRTAAITEVDAADRELTKDEARRPTVINGLLVGASVGGMGSNS